MARAANRRVGGRSSHATVRRARNLRPPPVERTQQTPSTQDRDLWTWVEIAAYLGLEKSATYERINQPGFPRHRFGQTSCRQWLAEDVRQWVSDGSTYISQPVGIANTIATIGFASGRNWNMYTTEQLIALGAAS